MKRFFNSPGVHIIREKVLVKKSSMSWSFGLLFCESTVLFHKGPDG